MNRLDMAKEIKERVDSLADLDKDVWKNAEKLRRDFAAFYTISKIRSMALDEFVIGKGAKKRSFCYRLERETHSLGSILGGTAFKFGVYFGRTKRNSSDEYRFSSIWGENVAEAFSAVKDAIVNLIEAALRGDLRAIVKNRLSPMFKGKLLFIYSPELFAPIYSIRHLKYFLANLDISGSFNNGTEMQVALMEYRKNWPELLKQPVPLYMRLLYDIFNSPENAKLRSEETVNLPLLDDAIKGAQFISQLPAMSGLPRSKNGKSKKIDFDKRQKQSKRTGDRGELIVIALEEKRLIQGGKPELASRIEHISQETDSAGYDILSFDEDGTPRKIEVKATRGSNLDRGFYISVNELEQSKILDNYYVYFVFSTMTNKPRVHPIKNPVLNGPDFELRPITYHVTVNPQGSRI